MVSMVTADAGGFTMADRDDLPEIPHGGKYELVEGMLVVSAAPTPRHQGFVWSLMVLLRASVPGELKVLHAPIDVVLSDALTLQPDVVVARRDTMIESGFDGPPLLAIEVLSPGNRRYDQLVKRRLYEEAGCPSYWIIDPGDPGDPATLTVLELVDGAYAEVAVVTGREAWTGTRPFPVTIVPDELVDD